MLRTLTIRTRLAGGFAILVALTVSSMAAFYLANSTRLILEAEKRELYNLYQAVDSQIETQSLFAEAMSGVVANNPQAQQAFAGRDRESLTQQFKPVFDVLGPGYGVAQFQFHTPPATSFLRLHKLEKQGDDLTAIRPTIVQTNASRQPVRGLDGGVAGIGIRGLSPMFFAGQHTGSVEFGLNLSQNFADRFSEEFGAEVAIHVINNAKVETLASTIQGNSLAGIADINSAWGGDTIISHHHNQQIPWATLIRKLNDFSGG